MCWDRVAVPTGTPEDVNGFFKKIKIKKIHRADRR